MLEIQKLNFIDSNSFSSRIKLAVFVLLLITFFQLLNLNSKARRIKALGTRTR